MTSLWLKDLEIMRVSVAQLCLTLCDLMDCNPPGSSAHGDSLGKNTGVGCHFFLQGTFPTQGSKLGLLHCRQILYQLSHQGSPGEIIKDFFFLPKTQQNKPLESGILLRYCLRLLEPSLCCPGTLVRAGPVSLLTLFSSYEII